MPVQGKSFDDSPLGNCRQHTTSFHCPGLLRRERRCSWGIGEKPLPDSAKPSAEEDRCSGESRGTFRRHVLAVQAAIAFSGTRGTKVLQSKAGSPPERPVALTCDGDLPRWLCSSEETPTEPAQLSGAEDGATDELLAEASRGWCFDAFALARATGNRPLSTLGAHLFHQLGLVRELGLDARKLAAFLAEIERGYDDSNPYHNRAHAASVLQMMHSLLERGGVLEAVAKLLGTSCVGEPGLRGGRRGRQLMRTACLLAAAVHDYEHEGVTNVFLVKTGHERAVRYDGQHVNELHHVSAAFGLLLRPEYNFLERLAPEEFEQLRALVVDLVVGTDMAEHGKIIKSAHEALGAAPGSTGAALADEGEEAAASEPALPAEAALLLQLALKCSDLGHLALDWGLHLRWVRRLEEEFFLQGDLEREAGLPVSFLMDRSKPGPTGSQVGFFEGVALPLFGLLVRSCPAAEPMLAGAGANCERWRTLAASGSALQP